MRQTQAQGKLLVIACGALAREIVWLQKANGWQQFDLQCLDAELHNRPKLIPGKLRLKIEQNRQKLPAYIRRLRRLRHWRPD